MRSRLLFGSDREVDGLLFTLTLALSIIGIILIFSARHAPEGVADYYMRQVIWLGISLVVFLVVLRIPLRFYEVFAYPILGFAIVLLIAVLFLGRGAGGAVRWFDLGFFNFQPSEWAKVAVVIAAARYLAAGKPHSPWQQLAVLGLICGIPAVLILREPDLGTALVFGALFLGLAVWSRIPMWNIALLVTPFISLILANASIIEVAAGDLIGTADANNPGAGGTTAEDVSAILWAAYFAILIGALFFVRAGLWRSVGMAVINLAAGIASPILWNRLHHYQQMRILTFLDPSGDPHGAGYQIIQSKVAIGSGGLLGKGFLAGSQTHLKFLPAQHTDFVFAVLGEEFGLLGTTIVLTLFGLVVTRGFWIAQRTRNRFGSYLAAGITTIILFHIMVNVGMTLGMFPVTGLPLPFLSYGGSFLLAMWANIAILTVISERWQEY
jgi:rod shape determining protein RodA